MKIKTMTVAEAEKIGFRVFKSGLRSYLPVALPRELKGGNEEIYNRLLNQFDPHFFEETGDTREGKFWQIVDMDTPGFERLLVTGYYSEHNGVEEYTVYGAVEVQ